MTSAMVTPSSTANTRSSPPWSPPESFQNAISATSAGRTSLNAPSCAMAASSGSWGANPAFWSRADGSAPVL